MRTPEAHHAGSADRELMVLTVPSHPKFLYVIRSALYPVLLEAGFGKRPARRMVLAVDEACSNIIKHAYDGNHDGTIGITVSTAAGTLVIAIRDFGKQVDAAAIAPRRLDDIRPGGLGTHFMAEAFDRVRYDTSQKLGTTLILEKAIA